MGRVSKIVAINIGIVLVIFWTLNLIASIFLETRYFLEAVFVPGDSRSELPNYTDKQRARLHFDEIDDLRTDYMPYVAWTRAPFRGETIHIDADGDRVHPATTDAPLGVVRFFGGSAMWGTGSDDAGTIPAQFNQLYPNYAVRNHGESGLVSRQSVARLVNLVNAGEPMDLVIFYDGSNDVGSLCRWDVSLNGHTREQKIQQLVRPPSDILEGSIGSLMQVLRFLIKPDVPPSRCESDPRYAEKVADIMIENWKIARRIAKHAGAEFLAVLQPVAWYGDARTDHFDDEPSFKGRQHVIGYPVVRERIAAQNAEWILDFSRAFDGDEYIFIDTTHVSANGNRIIVEKLKPYVDPILRGRIATRTDDARPPGS